MVALKRYSGKYAAINGLGSVQNWDAQITNTPNPYAASNTQAGRARSKGIYDFSGSITQLVSYPTVMPGDIFEFKGYLAPSSGVWNTPGPVKVGMAIVDSVAITWDYSTNAILSSVISFSGAGGPLTDTVETIADTSTPEIEIPEGLWLRWGNESDDLATIAASEDNKIKNVERAAFVLTCTNSAFVDSETGGWTGRERGTLDWMLDITQTNINVGDTPFGIDEVVSLVLPVNATEYWGIKWGKVLNYSGVSANIDTGEIMRQTINIAMQAHYSAVNIGEITPPGEGSPWWPWT